MKTPAHRTLADELGIQAERLLKIAVALSRAKTRHEARVARMAARHTSRAIAVLVR